MAYRASEMRLAFGLIAGLVLVLTFGGIISSSQGNTSAPRAEAGILDLSQWNFEQNGKLRLDGEWSFYWNRFLDSDEIALEQPDLIGRVPTTWNKYAYDGRYLPGQGYATYRLQIKTNLEQGAKMAILANTISSAYRIFIDDNELAAMGEIGTEPGMVTAKLKPRAVEFTVPDSDFDIIVHVSNYDHARGGLWYSLILGTSEAIARLDNGQENRQIFVVGALLVIMLTYICLFALRPQAKDYLYVALLALCLVVAIDTTNQFLIYRILPNISFHWLTFLWYASASWSVTLLAVFTESLYPAPFSKQIVRVFLIYSAAAALMYIFVPVRLYTEISTLLNGIGLVQLLTVLYLIMRAVRRNEEGSGLYTFGFAVAISAFIYDTLFLNNIIASEIGEINYIGIAALFFVQIIVQAQRYTKSFQQNAKLLEKLHLVNQLKDEFMLNTSHQIRSPLSAISTVTDNLLEGERGNLNDLQKESLILIKAFAKRVGNLVNDLYTYTKLKRGEISSSTEPVDLVAVAENVLEVFREIGNENGADLRSDFPGNLPLVDADENQLYHIIWNLIDYGVVSCSQGKVTISARAIDNYVQIRVSDTGPGIPNEDLANIFNFFEDTLVSPGRDKVSTGLALPIVRELVHLQGGEIKVESGEGGSAFIFTLSIAAKQETSTQLPPSKLGYMHSHVAPEFIKTPGQGPHVLIVDDNLDMLKSTVSIMELSGFAVTAVNSGINAVELAVRDSSFSVVILDVILPEISGYDICREIRRHKTPFDLPILIITAKTATKDIVMGFDAGANDYLAKPYEKEELLARVRTLANLKNSVDKAIASEVSFLQAQIKPHFLYNALSVIASLITANPQEARRLIVSFSEYLRTSFDFAGSEHMIPLEEELALVNAYVDIERARFGSRLEYSQEIDDISGISIPRLVLQPLVENAIRHGIFYLPTGGSVQLHVKKGISNLNFTVTDTGVGMSQAQAANLLTNQARGVGIPNIHKRLLRYYGQGLSIQSSPSQGTTVSFSVPLDVCKGDGKYD